MTLQPSSTSHVYGLAIWSKHAGAAQYDMWRKGNVVHDDVIKWKHFPRYWPFVRGIYRSPMNSPHKGQLCGALMFSLIWVLKKRLSKQSWGWWFETPSRSLWRHFNVHAWCYCRHNNLHDSSGFNIVWTQTDYIKWPCSWPSWMNWYEITKCWWAIWKIDVLHILLMLHVRWIQRLISK